MHLRCPRTLERVCFALLALWGSVASAHTPPLLPEKDVAALANELSGETAKRNVEGLARLHRQRGSLGFHSAAELVAERARAYGLQNVQILQFTADGKIFYGTQRSRRPWDADEAELSEVRDDGERKIASYAAEPVVLAEDSESADVAADLIDVGGGSKESDYAGKNVRGKLVLVADQPGEVQDLAVGKFGAAGIVSYAQNQKTAWSGDNDNLIRWGHLESFSPNETFGFMVSLETARRLAERLNRGERIRLHARVKAGQHPGFYEVVTATIDGADPALKEQEIAYSCHLDHQRPGANDNASGCATILEVARTLQKLIGAGKLARPARTLRFIWPPETAAGPIDEYERAVAASVGTFGSRPDSDGTPGPRPSGSASAGGSASAKAVGADFFRRVKQPRGPLAVFGYDYFTDHEKSAGLATPALLAYEGEWGTGPEYAYEALNFADGKHSSQQIGEALSAEYGAVPMPLVTEYLRALKAIRLVE